MMVDKNIPWKKYDEIEYDISFKLPIFLGFTKIPDILVFQTKKEKWKYM